MPQNRTSQGRMEWGRAKGASRRRIKSLKCAQTGEVLPFARTRLSPEFGSRSRDSAHRRPELRPLERIPGTEERTRRGPHPPQTASTALRGGCHRLETSQQSAREGRAGDARFSHARARRARPQESRGCTPARGGRGAQPPPAEAPHPGSVSRGARLARAGREGPARGRGAHLGLGPPASHLPLLGQMGAQMCGPSGPTAPLLGNQPWAWVFLTCT